MKKYFKGLLFRIVISLSIIFVILTVVDKIIYYNNEDIQWGIETKRINAMNSDKLQNSTWDEKTIIYKFKDEGRLPDKGDKKRILVIGDSFIWGYGYSNANHLWWKQLARIIYENGYKDVEVVAAGASGYSTEQELNHILKNKEVMKEIDPDLIIIGYVENDPQPIDENNKDMVKVVTNGDIYYNTNNIIIKFFKSMWPNLYNKISLSTVNKYMEDPNFQEKYGLQYNFWTREIISGKWKTRYESILSELDSYITNNLDCRYFFVPLITYPCRSYELVSVLDSFEKVGVPYYDLSYDYMDRYQPTEYSYKEWGINPGDGHPAVKATIFYAQYVNAIINMYYNDVLGTRYDDVEIGLDINDYLPYSLNPTLVDTNTYKIKYPEDKQNDSFLILPINKNYIKLNLKFPIKIKSIEITGNNIKNIELYTNSINEELGYDDQLMKNQGNKKEKFIWNLSGNERITSINIHANIKDGKSTDMYVKISY